MSKSRLTVEEALRVLADTVEQRGGYAKGSLVDRAVKKAREITGEVSDEQRIHHD